MQSRSHQRGKTILEMLVVLTLVSLISIGAFIGYNFVSNKAKIHSLAQSVMGFVKERQHANVDKPVVQERNVKGPFDIAIRIGTTPETPEKPETKQEEVDQMMASNFFWVVVAVQNESLCSELTRTDLIQSETKEVNCPENVKFYFKKSPNKDLSFPYYKGENGELKDCPENAVCSVDDFTCIEGYYKDGNECAKCGENVKACDDKDNPTECEYGYYLNDGECKVCQDGIPECDKDNQQCESGQYKKHGKCEPCPEHYKTCDIETGDFTCSDGYYKDGNECAKCGENVKICDDNGNPTECKEGYYLKDGKCEPCDEGVATCDNNGEPIKCEEGYYKKGDQCVSCPEHYKTCDTETGDFTCSDGYYKNGNECAECGENVKTCDDDGNPTKCKEGYYLNDGECKPCKAGETCEGCTDSQYPNWNGVECVCTQTSCSSDRVCNTDGVCVKKIDPSSCPEHSSTTVREGYQIGTSDCYCEEGYRVNDDDTGCTADDNSQCPENSSILSDGEDSADRQQTSVSGCYCNSEVPYWNGEECVDKIGPDSCSDVSSGYAENEQRCCDGTETVVEGYCCSNGKSAIYFKPGNSEDKMCCSGKSIKANYIPGSGVVSDEQNLYDYCCPLEATGYGYNPATQKKECCTGKVFRNKTAPDGTSSSVSSTYCCPLDSSGYAENEKRCCAADETLMDGYCCSENGYDIYYAPNSSGSKTCCSGKLIKSHYTPGPDIYPNAVQFEYCCPADATGYGYNPTTKEVGCCTEFLFGDKVAPNGYKYSYISAYCCTMGSTGYAKIEDKCCGPDEWESQGRCCPESSTGYATEDKRCCTANEKVISGYCCKPDDQDCHCKADPDGEICLCGLDKKKFGDVCCMPDDLNCICLVEPHREECVCPKNSSLTVREGYQIGTTHCYCDKNYYVNGDECVFCPDCQKFDVDQGKCVPDMSMNNQLLIDHCHMCKDGELISFDCPTGCLGKVERCGDDALGFGFKGRLYCYNTKEEFISRCREAVPGQSSCHNGRCFYAGNFYNEDYPGNCHWGYFDYYDAQKWCKAKGGTTISKDEMLELWSEFLKCSPSFGAHGESCYWTNTTTCFKSDGSFNNARTDGYFAAGGGFCKMNEI